MIRELLPLLLESLASGRKLAVCRLVETRGSTPQKPGAAMLVFADGSQAGTLGGGCVEAEVKRKALAAIDSRSMVVECFLLDNDYGWDDGLICGGRMQVLIDPVCTAASHKYYQSVEQTLAADVALIEAIAFDAASGITPPSCFLFDANRSVIAICGNATEFPAERHSQIPDASKRPAPSAQTGIAYLPLLVKCPLVIVGGGHVGQAVAKLAAELDFRVTVIDDRAEFVSAERFPQAERRIAGAFEDILPAVEITPNTFCLIVTRGHNHDERALYHLANRGARYVGMIGSKRKIRLIFDDLEAEGIAPDQLAKIHAPVGLDIGSQTVPEIAVSIAAELIACRNRNGPGNWGC